MILAAVLLFFQPFALANADEGLEPSQKFTPRAAIVLNSDLNFWNTSFVEEGLQFSPERNQLLGPWQMRYRWDGLVFTLGERTYSDSDPRFRRAMKGCYTERGSPGEEQSSIVFCRGVKTHGRSDFRMNKQKVSHEGLIALINEEPLRIEIRWQSGNSMVLTLVAPAERTWHIERFPSNEVVLHILESMSEKESLRTEAFFSDATLPRKPLHKKHNFKNEPALITEKGFDGTLRQRLLTRFQKIPLRRPSLVAQTRLSTYGRTIKFQLLDGNSASVSATKWEVRNLPVGRSEIEVALPEGRFQIEAWALKNSEISGQLSGFLLDANRVLVTGESSIVHYFENPFGDQFEDWNTHRWGGRLRYYGALSTFSGFQPTETLNMSFVSAEARALIRTGLWNLDSVYGTLVSVNRFDFFESSQNYLGVGGFWGRSMPHGIDHLFNKFSWFRYPKYVDLDVSLLVPMEQGKGASLSLVANFHGKMFIGRDWFISGGVGFFQIRASTRRELAAAVGTFGLGVMF